MNHDPYRDPRHEQPYTPTDQARSAWVTHDDRIEADRIPDGQTVPQPRPRSHWRWVITLAICALIIAAVLIGGAS